MGRQVEEPRGRGRIWRERDRISRGTRNVSIEV